MRIIISFVTFKQKRQSVCDRGGNKDSVENSVSFQAWLLVYALHHVTVILVHTYRPWFPEAHAKLASPFDNEYRPLKYQPLTHLLNVLF